MAMWIPEMRQLTFKVVYWGARRVGKQANLAWLAAHVPAPGVGKLMQLATETEHTSLFSFLPLEVGRVGEVALRLELYTVPANHEEGAAQADILRHADGVVLVVDARQEQQEAGLLAVAALEERWMQAGMCAGSAARVPRVLQYTAANAVTALTPALCRQNFNAQNAAEFFLSTQFDANDGAAAGIQDGQVVANTLRHLVPCMLAGWKG